MNASQHQHGNPIFAAVKLGFSICFLSIADICIALASSFCRPGQPVQGIPTIPSTLQEELDTNPFLRPNDPAIRKNLGACPLCVVLMASLPISI